MVMVSVCIPAHNNADTICQTIASVLRQGFDDFELIVIDDVSSDRTLELASSFSDRRVRVLSNDHNLGAVANWNRSVEEARGRYIKVLCGDDLIYSTCLERQVDALERHASAGVVLACCRRDIVYEDGSVILQDHGLSSLDGVVSGGHSVRRAVRSGTNIFGEPAAVLIRSDVLQRCGSFAATFPYGLDLDMWCRALQHGDLFADRRTLCAFRVRQSSWSRRLARQQSTQVRMLFREIRRRQPQVVSRWDELRGCQLARALMLGRWMAYGLNRHRAPRRCSGAAGGVPPPTCATTSTIGDARPDPDRAQPSQR